MMNTINEKALENVSGGTLQDGLEYLEELRKQYGLAMLDDVKKVWTAEEQFIFEMLLRKGVKPKPDPKLP